MSITAAGEQLAVIDEAMEGADERLRATIVALKGLYGLRDEDLGRVLRLGRTHFNARRRGVTKFTPAELAGLAAFFGVPIDTLYLDPADAVRAVLEVDPDLTRAKRLLWAARGSNPEPPGYVLPFPLPIERAPVGNARRKMVA